MAWQFILTDLAGVEHGELRGADERRVSLPHLRIPTASCRIPLWHSLAPIATETDCLLKCYRTDVTGTRTLAFHGPVITVEETAGVEGSTVRINAAGPYSRLLKRVIGKQGRGPSGEKDPGIGWGLTSPMDLGEIAHNILSLVNADQFTGISAGTRTAVATGAVGPWHLKNAGEAIADLHAGLGSFEYRLNPTEAINVAGVGGWPQIATLDIAPVMHTERPDAIYEYGTTRANVRGYSRVVSNEGILTRGIISVSGWPDAPANQPNSTTPSNLIIRDADNLATRGLFEEVVPDNGVIYNDLRQSIVDFHLLIRKYPRQTITFIPAANARPSPFTDYQVGDSVRARAVVRGTVKFDAMFRIWGLTFTVDKNGNENVELELVVP